MPASVCDPVSSALRLSLTTDDSQNSSLLDSRLYSSAKSVLLSKIEFEESGDYQSNVLDGLKSKYVVIRPKKTVLDNKIVKKEGNCSSQNSETKTSNGLPKPKCTLFPFEKVQLGWQGAWSAGAGMHNIGNTCYLNSTLQALFHVPAFANWLVSETSHAEKCAQKDGCVICGMRETLLSTQKGGGSPIKPWLVYSKLRVICKHLMPGRQEDAHEFLRYLVEGMEKSYLSRFVMADKLDQFSKETTPLNQILGGYLRSAVRCLSCHHQSITYQHFQDLLLDIRKHCTLDEALDSFFSRERLEDLGYKCEACNKKVSATKQFYIERAPMVLCIALKRFTFTGGKLSKHIQFRRKISLQKYIFDKTSNQPLNYKLVSMVTHLGSSQNCGHYTAIGQAPNGNYYQFDDSSVRPLPLSSVLGTNAYIMFFERDNSTEDISQSTLNHDKSPLKLTFYRNEERKINFESQNNKPIILNSTLVKSANVNSVPWVVKQNGEIERVDRVQNGVNKVQNGIDDIHNDAEEVQSDVDKVQNGVDKVSGASWIVSRESRAPLLSPSLQGDTTTRLKEKDENHRNGEDADKNSNTSEQSSTKPNSVPTNTVKPIVITKPMINHNNNTKVVTNGNGKVVLNSGANSNGLARHEVTRQLQQTSHRGYGAPVSSWAGTHSHMDRQVSDERRAERKRALEGVDDMDRGRVKKNKKFHHYNRFNNNRNYNPFQDKQNSGGRWMKYGDHRPNRHFHHKRYNNKYKQFNNRYNSGHHYRHH